MLDERGVDYRYREYTKEPLTVTELKELFEMLGVAPNQLLRKNDKAFKENGLTGQEAAGRLIELMAEHPTLLQRPVGVLNGKARVGRPPENLLELL